MQNNVPETYVNRSRDFQLLCRLYDVVMNGVKFDVDVVGNVIDNKHISTDLLPLLQSKLGFFDSVAVNDKLRYVLDAFPHIIKNKGSLKAVEQTVNVFLKANHISTPAQVYADMQSQKVIAIIKSGITFDTDLIDAIMKYILPTGYVVEYRFVTDVVTSPTIVGVAQNVKKYKLTAYNSIVRGGEIEESGTPNNADMFANAFDTVEVASGDDDEGMIQIIGSSEIAGGEDSLNKADENWGDA